MEVGWEGLTDKIHSEPKMLLFIYYIQYIDGLSRIETVQTVQWSNYMNNGITKIAFYLNTP